MWSNCSRRVVPLCGVALTAACGAPPEQGGPAPPAPVLEPALSRPAVQARPAFRAGPFAVALGARPWGRDAVTVQRVLAGGERLSIGFGPSALRLLADGAPERRLEPAEAGGAAREPFIGRERALERLRENLRDALEGRTRVVLLVGEPGWTDHIKARHLGKVNTVTVGGSVRPMRLAELRDEYMLFEQGGPRSGSQWGHLASPGSSN